MLRRVAVPFAFLAAAVAGCATVPETRVNRVDVEPAALGPPLRNVLVVAMTNDAKMRQELEGRLVSELEAAGVAATPSAPLLPPGEQATRGELMRLVEERAYDGVIVSRITGTRTREEPVVAPSAGWYGGLYDYYVTAWPAVYLVEEELTALETRVFRSRKEGNELAWTATTETERLGGREARAASMARLIRERLESDGVI